MTVKHSKIEILRTSLTLGLTSFGGPVAHLGYFKSEYIDKRKWLDEKTYADIIALCQFLPGPASSQVGIAIGMLRGGLLGGVMSWLGFTLPSVIVLVLFAFFYQSLKLSDATWISSLKIVAVAVVAHAVLGLGKKLTPDKPRIAIALAAALIMLLFPSTFVQIIIILLGAGLGYLLFKNKAQTKLASFAVPISKKQGMLAFSILVAILIGLPILARVFPHMYIQIADTFFRVGSFVFGGGHVVLPMLEQEIVPTGFLTSDEFLAGYGVAQAVPGPLFTFSSYVGTMMNGIIGAVIATGAIFLPSFLLIVGALPFLSELRERSSFQGMLTGVNASVVGLLLAAFYDPVFTSSILDGADFGLAVILFALLHFWKVPAWLIVIIGVIAGEIIHLFV
ncbi:chromate efflux transporter [Virgibacillus pantothenticus]|uniref:ChrA protein n=1 Tax=Virgibacillus pantothenticus TaxID=1473 RepID=A0A0L0QSA6_VIRPA|nr:chromate efflux transporter [Virgibacillus pantothenticus]KNE21481.1 ChrA protein [Virgibacillus pantothenticus]MED3736934.1 chromate efflux transporter [Virgibacillus pantothenticus]QTY16092.1 chromate efflux transporter [Virgibacillus pantothenticus]SIS72283.1 chromate transporter [Virgibacillus pantothenticus]